MRLVLSEVVSLIDGLSELGDLLLKYLSPHAITHSVTVDYEVLRV